jgi:hypothetical protein
VELGDKFVGMSTGAHRAKQKMVLVIIYRFACQLSLSCRLQFGCIRWYAWHLSLSSCILSLGF